MKILGIDPGYERLGMAIIEKSENTKEVVVFSDCVRTSSKSSMPERLFEIGKSLSMIIKKYKPDAVAIEELYFAKNTKTAMTVAEARGVIQYICKECGLETFEYHPNAIKLAITGNGAAKKEDIAFMVPKLISYDASKKLDDELDAIAVALTHLAHGRNTYPQLRK
jgi:crossover junction endodeoxyribonuclease RuvC